MYKTDFLSVSSPGSERLGEKCIEILARQNQFCIALLVICM